MYPPQTTQNRIPTFDARKRITQEDEIKKLKAANHNLKFNLEIAIDQNESFRKRIEELEAKILVDAGSISKLEEEIKSMRSLSEAISQIGAEKMRRCKIDPNRTTRNQDKNPNDILLIVSNYTGVAIVDMKSMVRKEKLVYARHLACYFLSNYTRLVLADIAEMITGKCDHSYVVNGRETIKEKMGNDSNVITDVEELVKIINNYKSNY